MNDKQARKPKIFLIVLLTCITLFSSYKYWVTLKEKDFLLKDLNQANAQVVALGEAVEKEKELERALAQENLTLKDELNNLSQLGLDVQSVQKTIEQLNSQIELAKAENAALREEKDNLSLELTQVSQERDTLKARLSSVPELKKTIKEVKAQMRNAKLMLKEIARKREAIAGNRGYLLKNGESTYPITKIKIEVMPAPSSK